MTFEKKRLHRNLGDYLGRRHSGRPKLKEAINEIITALPDTVIFGGMIREFALGNARGFVSDIDLVSTASQVEISRTVSKYHAERNKFGGFRFLIDKRRFDIWSLSDTWAFKGGFVDGKSFEDLLNTSFFNVDAACYHVNKKTLLFASGYEYCIGKRILDINLLQNPQPSSMARRALVLMQNHRLGVTRRLAEYIVNHIDNQTIARLDQLLINGLNEFLDYGEHDEFYFSPQGELYHL